MNKKVGELHAVLRYGLGFNNAVSCKVRWWLIKLAACSFINTAIGSYQEICLIGVAV